TVGSRKIFLSSDAARRIVLLATRLGVQMNYGESTGTAKNSQTGEVNTFTAYTCQIPSQDQAERFAAATASSSQYRTEGGSASVSTALLQKSSSTAATVCPIRVGKITAEDYDGYVYDLVEVEGTHSFASVLGIVTGNCCAYQFSSTIEKDVSFEDKLYFRDAKHFSMGSWQVVSVNCPRAAFKADGDDERLFAELRALMDVAAEVFTIKRRWMETIRTNGRMPFAMQRPKDPNTGERGAVAVDLDSLVYTIGVVGVNEMVQHHTGQQIHESKKAFKLAVRAMTEMELHAREISEKTGMTIALARTPAETTGQRFAVADMLDDRFRASALAVMQGDVETAVADCGNTRDLPV
ncbi:anaerobic ribonucleoside-triphosphate reductase, partial [Methanoculleus sp. 7T]|uniref:anaerobic ribonucleoside-triphosphate reductase n=1 Tax=Methanoculleus sp. 7T TaxID=2937282 RepID=UPI0024A6A8C7